MNKILFKNKSKNISKGFTLVELLAVLTVLSVILLIVIPTVLSSIKKAETEAEKENIVRYGRAIKQSVLEYQLNNGLDVAGQYKYEDDKYIVNKKNKDIQIKLNYEGENISCKTLIVNNEGEVYIKKCKIGKKEVEHSYGNLENFINEPDLYNGALTPVYHDGTNWKIIDEFDDKWYNYKKQKWANAVILKSGSTKRPGDTIIVDGTNPDILAMYVWIPRYEYKIEGTYGKGGTSTTSPGEIEINFVPYYEKNLTEEYRVHPAFTFGTKKLSGIWVAKFEMSHSSGTSKNLNCSTEICEEGNNLRVLPNAIALGYNNVSSFFFLIRSMSKDSNVFGIDKNITDTHMIKNSEWGAVAYLSQSKYGKYGNSDYTGTSKEVYINNSYNYYTGRSAGSTTGTATSSGTYKYDVNKNGTGASTTGNIYGIYDMSGSAKEYVMAVLANSSGELWAGNSGFTGKSGTSGINITGLEWPNAKYYDVHKATTGTTINIAKACNGGVCYGHALSETYGWYSDNIYYETANDPWMYRGEYYGASNAGIFASSAHDGGAMAIYVTRPVLVSAVSN